MESEQRERVFPKQRYRANKMHVFQAQAPSQNRPLGRRKKRGVRGRVFVREREGIDRNTGSQLQQHRKQFECSITNCQEWRGQ